jgi:hypothetical protein
MSQLEIVQKSRKLSAVFAVKTPKNSLFCSQCEAAYGYDAGFRKFFFEHFKKCHAKTKHIQHLTSNHSKIEPHKNRFGAKNVLWGTKRNTNYLAPSKPKPLP